jgi:hypothetical protein
VNINTSKIQFIVEFIIYTVNKMIFLKYKMPCHALSIGLGLEPLCIFLKQKNKQIMIYWKE